MSLYLLEEAEQYIGLMNKNYLLSNNMIGKLFDFPHNWYQSFLRNTQSAEHQERAETICEYYLNPERLIRLILEQAKKEIEGAEKRFGEDDFNNLVDDEELSEETSKKWSNRAAKEASRRYESIEKFSQSAVKILIYLFCEIEPGISHLSELLKKPSSKPDYVAEQIKQIEQQVTNFYAILQEYMGASIPLQLSLLFLKYPDIAPRWMKKNPVLGLDGLKSEKITSSHWKKCFEEKVNIEIKTSVENGNLDDFLSLTWEERQKSKDELFSLTCKKCKLKKTCRAFISEAENWHSIQVINDCISNLQPANNLQG